jgi:hypothetical protein
MCSVNSQLAGPSLHPMESIVSKDVKSKLKTLLYTEFFIYLLQELMEKLKMPSDADLMKIAIADLKNSSISLEDRQRALQELLVLVEPIDNANGKTDLLFGSSVCYILLCISTKILAYIDGKLRHLIYHLSASAGIM